MASSSLTLSVHHTPGYPLTDNDGPLSDLTHWSPSTSTLIYGPTSSLLVDIPFIASQARTLASWIIATLPDAKARPLTAIYITHGHADHFLGLPIILSVFPNAKVYAVPHVLAHMRQQAAPPSLDTIYIQSFGGAIEPSGLAEALDAIIPLETEASRTLEIDGNAINFVEAGQSDCLHSTFVSIPSLRAVVAGDIVYNGVHQYLGEASTSEAREAWIKSVELIESLKPKLVVAGHKKEGASDLVDIGVEGKEGTGCCRETVRYLRRLGRLAEMSAGWEDFFDEMLLEFPDLENKDILRFGAKSLF